MGRRRSLLNPLGLRTLREALPMLLQRIAPLEGAERFAPCVPDYVSFLEEGLAEKFVRKPIQAKAAWLKQHVLFNAVAPTFTESNTLLRNVLSSLLKALECALRGDVTAMLGQLRTLLGDLHVHELRAAAGKLRMFLRAESKPTSDKLRYDYPQLHENVQRWINGTMTAHGYTVFEAWYAGLPGLTRGVLQPHVAALPSPFKIRYSWPWEAKQE